MAGARTFTFLGTGTSVGVPMLGCDCPVCRSDHPRNHRYRCSALITIPNGAILIDSGPELRLQLLRERVGVVHAVLYTHYHADHLMGLDDLRLFPKRLGAALPIYCTREVEEVIRRSFPYAFDADLDHLPLGSVPRLEFQTIDERPFAVLGQRIIPVPLKHSRYDVFGFRIDRMAYCTDVSEIPAGSWPLLADLDVLVIDALRYKPHPAHFSLEQALDAIQQLKPRQAYLTHTGHELDYDAVNSALPPGVEMAYDGLRFEF
jgi:phosphoribosyl 1,2-cyclic phosphate phosphodiesterase